MKLPTIPIVLWILLYFARGGLSLFFDKPFDFRYWRCVIKKANVCPNDDIRFFLYTPGGTRRKLIDVRMGRSALRHTGWDPSKKSVILLHGFNGTVDREPLTFIKRGYLQRGDHNVVLVDWGALTRFPCYLSALSNTKLVAQCTAQMYAFLNAAGAPPEKLVCVGHSLGAHICGMMSNHLSLRQHRIIGLDPARPLIATFGSQAFRLTPDDARNVQVIHTNAGFLGEDAPMGHVDFCVNGGRAQPSCTKSHPLRNERCSHFQSTCFFADTITSPAQYVGVPCSASCPRRGSPALRRPGRPVVMGEHTPPSARGTYCVSIPRNRDCPFLV